MSRADRDAALERYCSAAWQTHEVRRRAPGFRECWPTTTDFKEHWPLLAPHLIQADWQVDGAQANSAMIRIEYGKLDPPPAAARDWHALYRSELQQQAGVAWDLAQDGALAKVFKRARLSPLEADVFRLRAVGDSVSSIARHLGRQKRTVETVLVRAEFKLRALGTSAPLEAVP